MAFFTFFSQSKNIKKDPDLNQQKPNYKIRPRNHISKNFMKIYDDVRSMAVIDFVYFLSKNSENKSIFDFRIKENYHFYWSRISKQSKNKCNEIILPEKNDAWKAAKRD